MERRRIPQLLTIILLGIFLIAAADDSIVFAPEYHFCQDLHGFLLQKDSLFRQRYFLEWSSSAEVAFISIKNRYFIFGEMSADIGLGKQDKAIISDPRELDAAFGLVGEYRLSRLHCGLGLDHRCFHQIDRDEWETTYWNRLYFYTASSFFRLPMFKERLAENNALSWKERLVWQGTIGYYVRELFGLVDTSALGYNYDYVVDLVGEVRYAVYRYRWIAVVLSGKAGFYFTKESTVRSTREMGIDCMATRGLFGMSVFLRWTAVDQLLIRQNKDGLLWVGITAFR